MSDIIDRLSNGPPTREMPVAYGVVLSRDPDRPYFTVQYVDGSVDFIPHGFIKPIVGRTWRVKWVLGSPIGDDWAATRDLVP